MHLNDILATPPERKKNANLMCFVYNPKVTNENQVFC